MSDTVEVPINVTESDGKWHYTCPCCGLEHVVSDKDQQRLVNRWSENLTKFVNTLIDTSEDYYAKKNWKED